MTTEMETEPQVKSEIAFAGDLRAYLEKARVSCQVHLTHLAKHDRTDPLGERILPQLVQIEDTIEAVIQDWAKASPVYQKWGRHVKGCGPMLLGAVMSRADITRLNTVSSMWAHYGFAPGQRRVKGQKLDFDNVGRTWCWRLGNQLIRYKDGKFRAVYDKRKEYEAAKILAQGGQVLSAAKGKEMTDGDMSLLQVHNRALRYMIKTVLACLWLEWRVAEGLSVSPPYIIGKRADDGHIHRNVYFPGDFLDR